MKVLLMIIMMNNPTPKWEHQGSFVTVDACETAVRKMKQEVPYYKFSHVCSPAQ